MNESDMGIYFPVSCGYKRDIQILYVVYIAIVLCVPRVYSTDGLGYAIRHIGVHHTAGRFLELSRAELQLTCVATHIHTYVAILCKYKLRLDGV